MHSAMEQTRHWMWTRRRFSTGVAPLNAAAPAGPSYESWEEQAFAEDSAGRLGGCVWPPRSYSCSFCRREFRSAQALGGHMNVHRRDRARLKQYSPNGAGDNHDEVHHGLAAQFAPPPCSLVYNPNPNFHKSPGVAAPVPLSPPRVSAMIKPQESSDKLTLISPSPIVREGILQDYRKESVSTFPTSLVDSIAFREPTVTQLKLGRDDDWRQREVGDRRRRRTSEEEEVPDRKRRRADPMLPFFVTPASANRGLLQTEVLKLGPNKAEELDLELRLGDRLA